MKGVELPSVDNKFVGLVFITVVLQILGLGLVGRIFLVNTTGESLGLVIDTHYW